MEDFLQRAIALATANVASGGGPFGAIVVRDGEVLASGANRVTRDHDPTAHAEVVAIRRACAALGSHSLIGCTMFASCEPCPLCLSAALWARLDRVVYAADRDDATAAGFDDGEFHRLIAAGPEGWERPRVERLRAPGHDAPFKAWRAFPGRVDY